MLSSRGSQWRLRVFGQPQADDVENSDVLDRGVRVVVEKKVADQRRGPVFRHHQGHFVAVVLGEVLGVSAHMPSRSCASFQVFAEAMAELTALVRGIRLGELDRSDLSARALSWIQDVSDGGKWRVTSVVIGGDLNTGLGHASDGEVTEGLGAFP